ncbi:MAG: hypothetical protein HRU80_02580 [Ignavibacteriales bacterium]|nr:MAG: hypothetical protein HRU80_02580 [Ignavibacteriales bacterium]
MDSESKTIFSAGRQVIKVRFVVYGLLLLAPVLFWAGTLVIGDPYVYNVQEQSSPAHQYFWGTLFMMMSAAIAAGILVYQDCYVTSLRQDKTTGLFTLATESLIGRRVHSFSYQDIKGWREDSGEYYNGKFHIVAPYISLRLKGRFLPFIIDLQGEVVEEEIYTLLQR